MYGWSQKLVRENKSISKPQSPSFSSNLLDEIYHSMDVGYEKPGEFKLREADFSRKQSVSGRCGSSVVKDEGRSSLRQAVLEDKWMDDKLNDKNLTRRVDRPSSFPESNRKSVIDNEPFHFGSVSSSSDTGSCFGPFRPKQVRTSVSFKKCHQVGVGNDYCVNNNHTNKIFHGPLIKSKARAMKIYADLKKVKQPISPGGRLTTFLNSFLTSKHPKKPKDLIGKEIETTSKSTHGSSCSSASSFTRSCLSKYSPRSRERLNNGVLRTVRFYPVGVIIDEECRPCGEKIISAEQDLMNLTMMSKNQVIYEEKNEDISDDDMTSDTSSDLFELDHLSTLQECDELPVYETTDFGTSYAITNGLIC